MNLKLTRGTITIILFSFLYPEPEPSYGGVAWFEPPQSIGTPLDDMARVYSGPGLAVRIAGRLRLDTDASLTPGARRLIRLRLAQGS